MVGVVGAGHIKVGWVGGAAARLWVGATAAATLIHSGWKLGSAFAAAALLWLQVWCPQPQAGHPQNSNHRTTPLQGIARYWPRSGDPETAEMVRKYLKAPQEEAPSPYLTAAVGTAVLGTIAYRRPRAAALFAGAVALMTAPYLGFMVGSLLCMGQAALLTGLLAALLRRLQKGGQAAALLTQPNDRAQVITVNRFSKFATKLVGTVETMDASGEGVAGFEPGWSSSVSGDDWSS